MAQKGTMVARVATDLALDKLFSYSVPAEMAGSIKVGQRVRVPFGRRTLSGYVMELPDKSGERDAATEGLELFARKPPERLPGTMKQGREMELRPLLAIEDETPYLSPALVRLARWMADYTCASIEIALRCMLPAPVRNREMRAKELLHVSPLKGEFELTKRQRELHENLVRVDGGWLHALAREFSCSPQTIKTLAAKGAARIEERQMRRDPLAHRKIMRTHPLTLMPEQAEALARIVEALEHCAPGHPRTRAPQPILLFGVTGSGKTEVYLQAIARALECGMGAIILVPEIALTPQTVQRFAARFGEMVAVLHSGLSAGERFDEWHRIRNGAARVVVGPRSAIFAPVRELGLIVVDEEHEPSYKQEEMPRYNARDMAVMRAHYEPCAVVLGSATPSMESWLNTRRNKYVLSQLPRRVAGRSMPRVNLVDMRLEAARSGHATIFSSDLLAALKLRLERGEQSILFLNRRGYSNSLVCPFCGYVAECEACDIAFTFHQADTCLRCHICGAWRHLPNACPECGDIRFKYAGFGTQRAERALRLCFPQARVLRMDADVTTRKRSHDEILAIFKSGRADILLGTQMIAKGLDFPNVTLVGVLMADLSLHIPDFRAGERTYQLLAQVSGRAGRADLPGEVFLQTYSPDHPAIRAAASDAGFAPFAERELAERKEGGYPPYRRMVCLTFKGASEEQTRVCAEALEREIKRYTVKNGVRATPPCPAPLAKAKGRYRYQTLLFAETTRAMTVPLRAILNRITLPPTVSLAIDVDAINIS